MTKPSDEKTTINEIKQEIARFNKERDWAKYHTPKNLAISICIEAAELLENFQWLADDEIEKALNKPESLHRISSELAAVIDYAFTLADNIGIDISTSVIEKIRENEKKYPVDKIKGDYRKYSEIK